MSSPHGRIDTVEKLSNLLVASGLITADAANRLRSEICERCATDISSADGFALFKSELLSTAKVTPWQLRKLLSGRYRGFFLDGYKLIDHVSAESTYSQFLAESPCDHRQVLLCIRPPTVTPLIDGKPEYWVEELPSAD